MLKVCQPISPSCMVQGVKSLEVGLLVLLSSAVDDVVRVMCDEECSDNVQIIAQWLQ